MINIPALFDVLRVSTTATDKKSWATKSLAYATLSGLLMAALPFIPPNYAQYINAEWITNFCGTAIGLAAAFGLFGTTNFGVLPAKSTPIDRTSDVRQNDMSGGA